MANALELRLFCTEPSNCGTDIRITVTFRDEI